MVVRKFIMQLEAQLADRNVTIELSDDAADWLAKNGFDELYGARPLARVIQEHIKKPLADEILFGKLVRGGHVTVTLENGKLAFSIEEERGGANPGDQTIDGEAVTEDEVEEETKTKTKPAKRAASARRRRESSNADDPETV